jgi:hypothetical protein
VFLIVVEFTVDVDSPVLKHSQVQLNPVIFSNSISNASCPEVLELNTEYPELTKFL